MYFAFLSKADIYAFHVLNKISHIDVFRCLTFNNCFYQDFYFIHNSQYETSCSTDDEKSQDQLFIYLLLSWTREQIF